jgi:NTP pyrophosphatase (non-canonical NTP hydrolase)
MSDNEVTFQQIKGKISEFNKARNWDHYHNPKDLAMAISIEAAELLENFQWETAKPPSEIIADERKMAGIRDETADMFIYLLILCNRLDMDASSLIEEKISKNGTRFPPGTEHSFRKGV